MLNVSYLFYAECFSFYCYAECRFAECRYAECRGALATSSLGRSLLKVEKFVKLQKLKKVDSGRRPKIINCRLGD